MTSEYGASVLVHVLRDVKRQGGRVTASHGEMLAAMDPQDLQLLQAASELAAKRAVTRVTATPSGRSFFRIHSLNRFRSRNGESERVANDGISQPFDPSMASETQPNYYNCFEHYCSCLHFHDEVVKNPVAMCKHMVAALLADATNQLESVTIQDADFAKMLCPPEDTAPHSDDEP